MTAAYVDNAMAWELPGVWMLADDVHTSTCGKCGAPIVWGKNADSGKRAPFDPLPEGTELDGQTVSSNHFGTCPRRARP